MDLFLFQNATEPFIKEGKNVQLTMGKALALIFTGCGIMLLLNFCILFIVDNIKKNSKTSIIRRRQQNRRRSVSFADPLVKQTIAKRGQSVVNQPEEIEMVDLSSIPAPVQAPPPLPPPKPLTRQKQPNRASTKVSRPTSPPPLPPAARSAIQTATLPRQPVRKAPPVPSAFTTTTNLTRSMSVRQPHRD
jgi:hypothetical protein